jgi:hypothetical protein
MSLYPFFLFLEGEVGDEGNGFDLSGATTEFFELPLLGNLKVHPKRLKCRTNIFMERV